jgi:hypothetical protein
MPTLPPVPQRQHPARRHKPPVPQQSQPPPTGRRRSSDSLRRYRPPSTQPADNRVLVERQLAVSTGLSQSYSRDPPVTAERHPLASRLGACQVAGKSHPGLVSARVGWHQVLADAKVLASASASASGWPAQAPAPAPAPPRPSAADRLLPVATAVAGCRCCIDRSGIRPIDARPIDARLADARPIDARPIDARPIDARSVDARPADARPIGVPGRLGANWFVPGRVASG